MVYETRGEDIGSAPDLSLVVSELSSRIMREREDRGGGTERERIKGALMFAHTLAMGNIVID